MVAWVFVAAFVAASTAWVVHHYFGHPERIGPDLRAHFESCLSVGEGRFFENTGEGGSTFRVHTPVILVLLLPIFFCFPSPYTLIIASNIALALTAWPLYRIVRARAGERCALALCAAFLLAPTSTSPLVLLEFTPLKFAPLGIAICLLAFEQERFGRFALFFLLSLTVREDVALTLAAFGLLARIRGRDRRWVLFPILAGLGWAVVAVLVVIPAFRGGGTPLAQFFDPEGLLAQPGRAALHRLRYLIQLLVPMGAFLPLLGSEAVLLLPQLAINLLSLDRMAEIRWHYSLVLLPILIVSTAGALERFYGKRISWAVALTLVAANATLLLLSAH